MANTKLSKGRGWLRSDAAASVARIDKLLGRALDINSAGRTRAQQLALLRRWAIGGKYNRPPYLYKPAAVSPHESGLAIDTDDTAWMRTHGAAHGWTHPVASDVPHFVYVPAKDKYRVAAPKPPKAPKWPGNLKLGSRGSRVKAVQRKVGAYADGIYGPITRSKVRAFQRKRGLVVDGIVGPITWHALGL